MTNVIKLSASATQEFWEIPVLHEDDRLLAIAKPARLLTSPDRYDAERPNLMKLLHRDIERAAPWAKKRQLTYLANVHRLDYETSGVLLLAKDKPALVAIANQFGAELPHKVYAALVHGSPREDQFKVGAKLGPHPVKVGIVRVDEKNGKKALTEFEVLERFTGMTLLKCRPATGRTHQIRVHLQNSGMPVVGDELYGGTQLLLSNLKPGYRLKHGRVERPLIARVALHAEQLTVTHPATGAPVVITAPWPNDLLVAVKYLRRYAASGTSAKFVIPIPGPQEEDAPDSSQS